MNARVGCACDRAKFFHCKCLLFPVYLCGGCFLVLFHVIGNSLEDRAMLWNAGKSHPGDRKGGRGLPSWKTDASGVW